MQADDFRNLPFGIFKTPENDKLAVVRNGVWLGGIVELVHTHFNCAIILNRVNFDTPGL